MAEPAGDVGVGKSSLTPLGAILIVFGLLLSVLGTLGLNAPHTCPLNVAGCTTSAYPIEVAAIYLGPLLVVFGVISLIAARYRDTLQKSS